MIDDIVTRLRGWEVEPYPAPVGACIRNGAVMEEAADEIERLREEFEIYQDKWRKVADGLYKQVCIDFCWHCGHERTREYTADEAVTLYRDAVCDEQV